MGHQRLIFYTCQSVSGCGTVGRAVVYDTGVRIQISVLSKGLLFAVKCLEKINLNKSRQGCLKHFIVFKRYQIDAYQ